MPSQRSESYYNTSSSNLKAKKNSALSGFCLFWWDTVNIYC